MVSRALPINTPQPSGSTWSRSSLARLIAQFGPDRMGVGAPWDQFKLVVEGMEAVDQIKKAPAGRQSGQVDDPDEIVRMQVLADIEE